MPRKSERKILGLDLIFSPFAGGTEVGGGEILSCPQVDRVQVYTVYVQNQFFSSDLERARDTCLAITSLQPGLELLLWPSLRWALLIGQNQFYLVTFQLTYIVTVKLV